MKYLPRVLHYLRPYWKLATVSAIFLVLSSLLSPLGFWPVKIVIDSVLTLNENGTPVSPMPWPLSLVLSGGESRAAQIAVIVIFGLLISLSQNLLGVLDSYVNTKLEQNMILDFRSDIFQHLQRLSLSYHERKHAGMAMYLSFMADAPAHLIMAIPALAQSLLTLIWMFTIVLLLDPLLALLALLVVPFLYYSVGYYARHIQDKLWEVNSIEGQALSIIHEAVSMLRVIVTFGREGHEYRRFRWRGERAVDARLKITLRQTTFSLVVDTITAIGTALVLGFGAYHVLQGRIAVGTLFMVMGYIASIYKPLESISTTVGSLQDTFVNMKMAMGLLETEPDIQDAPGAVSIDRAKGHVIFEGVYFEYTGRVDTLKDVSFETRPGEIIAIVGQTGAGKTTLVSLLPRLYDLKEGRILLDGKDIRELTLKSLREQVSIVLQEALLFSGTIADNIRYGRLEATREEVIQAAIDANAHDFIMALPEQYDTVFWERGAQISGGERRRIAVARAFLKNAPILILDEPTSAIDSKTEAVILDALDRLMVGRTTFMIAHRLSTIRNADRILVMDRGRLVEQGTHDELLAMEGLYKELRDLQEKRRAKRVVAALPEYNGACDLGGTNGAVEEDGLDEPEALVENAQEGAAVNVLGKKKIVLLGMMTRMPVAGAVWGTMHYLIGFQRLGYDVYYVEAHAKTPYMLMEDENDDSSRKAAAFLDRLMRRFDLGGRWAFHALHDDGRYYGMTETQLKQLYGSAALIINHHGATVPLPEHYATRRLIYLETDPVELQVGLYDGVQAAIDFLEPHVAFFSWGLNYGRPDCRVPLPERFPFRTTPPAVVFDLWRSYRDEGGDTFTTVGNWGQPGREVRFRDEVYHWSKHYEFLKFLDLPRRTEQVFELALASSSHNADDQRLLESNGWRVRDALNFSRDLDAYRRYIAGSRGEFTVAKDQNIRLRSGWFSERSAQYLAAGRPVITQETGFSNVLPTGKGLFGFSTMEEILAAVSNINGAYKEHCSAAAQLARDYFNYDVVLPRLLAEVGV